MPVAGITAKQSTTRSAGVGLATGVVGALPGGALNQLAVTGINAIISAVNHPYGTCAPDAATSAEFLRCWKHAKPARFIPYYKGNPTAKQPGTKGWDFAVCVGATDGSVPPPGGCNLPSVLPQGCDCSSAPCVCAPVGAVEGLHDGTFVDANGNNLGPAVINTNLAPQIAYETPSQGNQPQDVLPLGLIGNTLPGGGAVTTNRSVAASGLQNASLLGSGTGLSAVNSNQKLVIAAGIAATLLLGAFALFGGRSK